MSIQSEIERISNNVQSTLNTIADTGVAVASGANSDDLPALAAALANEKSDIGHTHSAATTSAAGFMSASDKSKLNGIATGANKYTLPTASSSTLGGVKTTSTVTSNSGYTACPIIGGVPYYKDTNTTYNMPKTTTITASATVSANAETAISISYSGFAGTILLTFFCGITASNSSGQVTKAVPTYSTLGRVDRVRVLSTSAQTINVCIGVIYQ